MEIETSWSEYLEEYLSEQKDESSTNLKGIIFTEYPVNDIRNFYNSKIIKKLNQRQILIFDLVPLGIQVGKSIYRSVLRICEPYNKQKLEFLRTKGLIDDLTKFLVCYKRMYSEIRKLRTTYMDIEIKQFLSLQVNQYSYFS